MNDNRLKPSGASVADSEKTAAVSHAPSVMDHEKTDTVAPSTFDTSSEPQTAPRTSHSKDPAIFEEVDHNADQDGEIEYPKAWRLAVITIALCLSVFCMALVRVTLIPPEVPHDDSS